MKAIKIFSKSQLILLRNINPLLKRYRLPRSVLRRIDYILEEDLLGIRGFIIVILTPVRDDIREIEDAVNLYPLKVTFTDEWGCVEKQDTDRITAKNKEWFAEKLYIQSWNSYVYVLYYMSNKAFE